MNSNKGQKPVIFIAFSNARGDLRKLAEEQRLIRGALEDARKNNLCEYVERSNATADDIFDVFQNSEYRDRIAVFHFGGHANDYQLLLESAQGEVATAEAKGLAAFLGQQHGLQLIFLNGCSTRNHKDALLNSNVSAVISTSQAIDDEVAMMFAVRFYQGLANGDSIERAYKEAEASVRTTKGENPRNAYVHGQDGPQEDRWPWGLYEKKGAEIVRGWNLPACVGDPLFSLPHLMPGDLPEKPFRGLHWFTKADAEVFFGRGSQIRELYERVTGPDTPPILLMYGQSGVGKSSILDAGLMPRLEQDHAIRYFRRDRGAGLLGALNQSFLPGEGNESVAQAWQATEGRLGKPLVVILDQVDEVFTRPNKKQPNELPEFLSALETIFCVPTARPRGKLILSFRKEWLPEIKQTLRDHKLARAETYLERLDRQGIIESVTGIVRSDRIRDHYGLSIEKDLAEIIADDLLEDPDSPVAPTLQILLTKMWDEASKLSNARPRFDANLYKTLKSRGILLRDFLDQQITEVRKVNSEYVDSGLVLDILTFHTTPLGTTAQRTPEKLQQEYRHQSDALPAIVNQFKALYLLADPSIDNDKEAASTRLAHDTLAYLIRERFDKSVAPGQRARRLLESRAVEWRDGQQGTPFDERDLSRIEMGASGMRAWKPEEERLVEASRRECNNRENIQKKSKAWRAGAVIAIIVIAMAAVVLLFVCVFRPS